jgi:hypothetical protein
MFMGTVFIPFPLVEAFGVARILGLETTLVSRLREIERSETHRVECS